MAWRPQSNGPDRPHKSMDAQRGNATQRGYGAKWQKARAAYLRRHPICKQCPALATEVDHITPHCGNMQLFWDSSNWQPLCKSCHSAKTMRESREKSSGVRCYGK